MTSVSYNFSTLMSTKCSKSGRWSNDAGPLDFGSSQELEQQMDLRGVPRHRFLLLGEIPGGGTTFGPTWGPYGIATVGVSWPSLSMGFAWSFLDQDIVPTSQRLNAQNRSMYGMFTNVHPTFLTHSCRSCRQTVKQSFRVAKEDQRDHHQTEAEISEVF